MQHIPHIFHFLWMSKDNLLFLDVQIKGLNQLSGDKKSELDEQIKEIQPKFDMLKDVMKKMSELTTKLKNKHCTEKIFKDAQECLKSVKSLNSSPKILKGRPTILKKMFILKAYQQLLIYFFVSSYMYVWPIFFMLEQEYWSPTCSKYHTNTFF